VHPEVNTYAFPQCDYIMGAGPANSSDSVARMHNYCWDNENPGWLNSMKNPADLKAALQGHIGNMSKHYLSDPKLAYYAVDVVNEAVSDGGEAILKPTTPWYPALPTYVEDAFAAADAADKLYPGSRLLCYNDYGAEGYSSSKAKKVIALIKQIRTAGAMVNCVGLQMHVSIDQHPDPADVAENIRQLGLLGLTVHITEMDVKCSGCTGERLKQQAMVYANMLQACLNNTNCKSFETWGVTDRDTWVGTENSPLLFDSNYKPKPAYDAVLATLQQHVAHRRTQQ
jgi:endo-1,4-beta-xylanase